MFGSSKASTVKCSVMDRTPQMTRSRESATELMVDQIQPPRRPQRNVPQTREYQRYKNDFLSDFESTCLQYLWVGEPPKGVTRHEDPEWAEMIQSQVYPHHSDVDWYEYCEWVMGGGGDVWFYDELARAPES